MTSAKRGVREFYDKTAQQWADKWYADDSMLPLLQTFMEELPQQPRMLDLCCGAGYESMRMAKLGAQVIGLDISEACIAIAREKNPTLEFHVDDMLADYAYIGPVDAVVCSAGLVHLHVEQLRTAFARMSAVLKPGGRALFTVRDGVGRQAGQSDVEIDGQVYDRAFYAHTLEELREAATDILAFTREIENPEPSPWRNDIFVKI